jgi:hypothetical protein
MLKVTELSGFGSGVKALPGSVTLLVDSTFVNKTGTFTVPRGVTRLRVTMCGGGGGGGGNWDSCGGGSGGGGAGYYSNQILNVAPGQVLSYTVGMAGDGGGYIFAAVSGGNTVFGSLTATGGGLGNGNGGAGGAAGIPSGQAGQAGAGGKGGDCTGFGTGGVMPTTATGNGSGGGGSTGCYQYTCGDNRGCPGTPGKIFVEWGF